MRFKESNFVLSSNKCHQWNCTGLVLGLVIALGISLVCKSSFAQGDDMTTAREAFAQGQAKFDEGDYLGAIEAYKRSFEAFPHFRTLFNIALCEEKRGNVAAAREMYTRYVEWPAEVPNRAEIRKKIEELDKQLPKAPEPVQKEPVQPEPPIEQAKVEPVIVVKPGPNLSIPGWTVLGTGAAGIVVSGVLLGVAASKSNEMRSLENSGEPYDPDKHGQLPDEGRVLEKAGWVTGAIGLAAVATGIVLLLVSRSNSESTGTVSYRFYPQYDGGYTGLAVRF